MACRCCPNSNHSACKVCRRGWPAPRNIRHVNLSGNARGIHHHTKDTIVAHLTTAAGRPGAPSFPSSIFRRITFAVPRDDTIFVDSREGDLVTHFHFDKKTGDIFHHPGRRGHSSDGYARLVTLNWWWIVLQKAVLQVGLGIFEISTTASFCFSLFTGLEQEHLKPMEKWVFLVTWCLSIAFVLMTSLDEARKEWNLKCHPRIGDLAQHPGSLSAWASFLALVSFMFFGMEAIVRDIVMTLHPWKGLQPYAAIKFEGTRAYILGYDSDEHYMIWNWSGQHRVLLARVFSLVVMILFKGFILGQSEFKNWLFGWNVFTTFVSLVSALRKWATLVRARVHYRRERPDVFKEVREHGVFSPAIHNVVGKEEEQVVWREHAFVLSHFSSSHNVCQQLWAPEGDEVCTGCRRKTLTGEQRQRLRESAVTHAAGSFVRLADHSEEFADAAHGPLRKGDIGEVVEVGPPGVCWGTRVLVRPLTGLGCAPRRGSITITSPHPVPVEWLDCGEWWYDAGALLPVDPEAVPPRDDGVVEDRTDAAEAMELKPRAGPYDSGASAADRITISETSDAMLLRGPSTLDDVPGPLEAQNGSCTRGNLGKLQAQPRRTPVSRPLDMPTESLPLADAIQQLSQWAVEFERQARAIGARLRKEGGHDSTGLIRHQVCPLLVRTTTHLILDSWECIEEHPELVYAVSSLTAAVNVTAEAETQTYADDYLGVIPDTLPARTSPPVKRSSRRENKESSANMPPAMRIPTEQLAYWKENASIPQALTLASSPILSLASSKSTGSGRTRKTGRAEPTIDTPYSLARTSPPPLSTDSEAQSSSGAGSMGPLERWHG